MATPIPTNRARIGEKTAAMVTGGVLVQPGSGDEAVGIFSDSRAVVPGSAFVALKGESFDGHAFVAGAIAAGAVLVVVEKGSARDPEVTKGAAVVEVDDTLVAWGALGRAHVDAWRRNNPDARLVAITGSAGKTTTKAICTALLEETAPTHATAGNLNNRIGVPAVLFGLEGRHVFAVIEVGMSVPGEIAALGEILRPDVAVITNIGVAHAAGVGGTLDGVAREKGALFAALSPEGAAIVNLDDHSVKEAVLRSPSDIMFTFGRAASADYRIAGRSVRGSGASWGAHVVIQRRWEQLEVDLPLLGEGAAIDFAAALAAAEVARGTPFTLAEIDRAMTALVPPAGRAFPLTLGDGTLVIDDTYNANPSSMRSALDALEELARATTRRSVAVLGEMKELGAMAESSHAALGADLARTKVGLAIGCGGLVDLALDVAAAAGAPVFKGKNVDDAALYAKAHVLATDVVLVKGSRSVMTEKVIDALRSRRGAP
ncbi:MAG: UDP-N-acetylmuramoyl-tripeptide--D-alanyl-D-alanine ligase [Polyangiaceae bacterium]